MIGLHEGGGKKAKRTKHVEKTFVLLAAVAGCRPKIWRRLQVRETMWLSQLHDVLQVAFDWYDYQTHSFQFDDQRFGNPLKREELQIEDDRDFTLADLDLAHRNRFVYGYHFGEGWLVEIQVEKIGEIEKGVTYPVCLGGERAGPPEDCGGLEAYHDMVASLKEPTTDLGREWREWIGPDYDPETFDQARVAKAFRKLRK